MMNEIKIITDYEADWQVLYINGKLEYANHTVNVRDLKKYKDIKSINTIDLEEYPNCKKYINEYGDFPKEKNLEEFLTI